MSFLAYGFAEVVVAEESFVAGISRIMTVGMLGGRTNTTLDQFRQES